MRSQSHTVVAAFVCALLIGVQALDKTAVVAGVLGYAGGYLKGAAVHDWYLGQPHAYGAGYGGYDRHYGGYYPYAYGPRRVSYYPTYYDHSVQAYGRPYGW